MERHQPTHAVDQRPGSSGKAYMSKTLQLGTLGVTLLVTQMVIAEQVIDISFEAPLYCANEHKSILYAATSFNKDSFTKVTDLAYFTDGYANIPVSNFYSARGYRIEGNTLTVDLAMLVGSNTLDYGPQKSGITVPGLFFRFVSKTCG
jgi:hypothetical protein